MAGRHAVGAARRAEQAFHLWLAFLIVFALTLGACSRSDRGKGVKLSKRVVPLGQPVPKGGGIYKIGTAYEINGRWYYPREEPGYDKVGVASWYGELFHGRYTSNGEIYDMNALTAAHPTLPMPVYAQVTNLRNGRSLIVRVNDRGPYAHDRIIDLSRMSARALGFERNGTAPVRVTYLGKAPLNGDDAYERRYLASRPWARYAGFEGKSRMADAGRPDVQRRMIARGGRSDPMAVGTTAARNEWSTTLTRAMPPESARPRYEPLRTGAPLFIQAGAFRSPYSAESVRRQLAGLGPAYVFPAEVGGRMYYRVRIGPFRERGNADRMLQRVVDAGVATAEIVDN